MLPLMPSKIKIAKSESTNVSQEPMSEKYAQQDESSDDDLVQESSQSQHLLVRQDEESLANTETCEILSVGSDSEQDEGSSADISQFQQAFPQFNWVVRDLDMDFKHLTPMSYLQQNLEPSRIRNDVAVNRNQVRRCLKDFFGGENSLNCYALSTPSEDSQVLESLCEKGPKECLQVTKPLFGSQITDLVTNLKQSCEARKIGGRYLTGAMFLNLALEFIDQLNENEKLQVMPSMDKVIRIELE